MSEKESKAAEAILSIFDRLPEAKKERLLGVAEGLDMAANAAVGKEEPK